MILKNLMEDKQLNFNRPLLSVRRGSSSTTTVPPEVNKKKSNENDSQPSLPPLPYYKSDLKSGPVRNPGVVPFRWEQSPGTPKNRIKGQIQDTLKEQFPPAPKPPPGRILNHKPTDKEVKDSPASSSRSHSELVLSSLELSSWEKAISVLQEPEEGVKTEEISSSDDENVIFEDARDKLSRTDSFFLNCSVSGVAGLDDPISDPSRGFLDPQARDFMMGRFLPAAKAVASETPHSAGRKHPVGIEQPKPAQEVAARSMWAPQDHSTPSSLRYEKGSPQSFLCRERGFLGLPEEYRDFRAGEVDLHKNGAEKIRGLSNPATEKTVYMDSEQMVETWSSNSSSSESRGRSPSVDYSLQDIKSLYGGDEKTKCQPKSSEMTGTSALSTSKKLTRDIEEDDNNNTTTQYGSRSSGMWGKDMKKKQPLKPDPTDVTPESRPPLVLAPLLPQSPSESWLSRTLPSVSFKNQSSKPYAGHMPFRPSPMDPKRDRLLKISIVKQHMLFHHPGELAPILED